MNYPEITANLKLPEILGRPKKGIIFSDLDGVWLDESRNFAPPAPEFAASITMARKAGFWVVLNSDTAPKTLSNYATELGSNDWVVAENGGIIYLPKVGNWLLSSFASEIKEVKRKTIELLKRQNPSAYIWRGDATPFIQQQKTIPDATSGQTVYLVNTSRITSLGIYTRKVSADGQLEVDDAETQKTEQTLLSVLDKEKLTTILRCKRYPAIGSCLVKDPFVNKADAVKRIVDQYGKQLSYWMIGDSLSDSMLNLRGTIRIAAVGNAEPQLKIEATQNNGIVAPVNKPIAQGANYIIRQILRKEKVL